jgi:hypothetical protein
LRAIRSDPPFGASPNAHRTAGPPAGCQRFLLFLGQAVPRTTTLVREFHVPDKISIAETVARLQTGETGPEGAKVHSRGCNPRNKASKGGPAPKGRNRLLRTARGVPPGLTELGERHRGLRPRPSAGGPSGLVASWHRSVMLLQCRIAHRLYASRAIWRRSVSEGTDPPDRFGQSPPL